MRAAAAQQRAASMEREHPVLVHVGRVGWFAKGIVYVLAGVLVDTVALRHWRALPVVPNGDEASPTGAVVGISRAPGSRVLLALLAAGLAVYCLWRLATAVLPGTVDAEALAVRVGYLISALIYGGLCVTAFELARRPQKRTTVDGDRTVRDLTQRVLVLPVGRVLVGLAGLVTVAAALFRLREAVQGRATDDVRMRDMPSGRRRWTRHLATVGETGRAVAIALVGAFLLDAARAGRADRATGLDGALQRVAVLPWGAVVVAFVGTAFVLYGLVCLETFGRRRLVAH